MEFLFTIIALIAYAWSIISKNRDKDQKYEYPEIPDRVPAPTDVKPPPVKRPPVGAKPVETSRPEPTPVKAPSSYDIIMPPVAQPTAVKAAKQVIEKTARPPVATSGEALTTPAIVTSEFSPWSGVLNENMVINGIIFAEVIQAPRSKRPMSRGIRR